MSVLQKILVDRDQKTLSVYLKGTRQMLRSLYKKALDTTLATQWDTTHPTKQLFLFLVVLNREPAMKRFIVQVNQDDHVKLNRFWNALQRVTEGMLLSFTCTESEYVQTCIEEWIIA
jgi:hypothetical protein